MSRKRYSMIKQFTMATMLALGASSLALADDNGMNPSGRGFSNGDSRGTPNLMAQNCPQGMGSATKLQKKVEQEVVQASGGTPAKSAKYFKRPPSSFNQHLLEFGE